MSHQLGLVLLVVLLRQGTYSHVDDAGISATCAVE